MVTERTPEHPEHPHDEQATVAFGGGAGFGGEFNDETGDEFGGVFGSGSGRVIAGGSSGGGAADSHSADYTRAYTSALPANIADQQATTVLSPGGAGHALAGAAAASSPREAAPAMAPATHPAMHPASAQPTASDLSETAAAPRSTGPERFIVRFRPHGRRLFLPTLLFFGLCAGVGYFGFWYEDSLLRTSIWGGGGALLLLAVVFPYLRWLCSTTTITSERIVLRSGVFARTRSEVPLNRVAEITVRSTVLQRLFRTGTIILTTSQNRRIRLMDAPHATLLVDALHELITPTVPELSIGLRAPLSGRVL